MARKAKGNGSGNGQLMEGDPGLLRDALQVVEAMEQLPPEMMQEAFGSQAALELALEDRGWLRTALVGSEMDLPTRENVLPIARRFYRRDPLSHQAVRLWTAYSVGTGHSVTAKGRAASILEELRLDPRNRTFFSAQGQQKNSNRLLIDGDLFVAIFDTDSGFVFRRLDSRQVTEIITNPEDAEEPWFYKRMVPGKAGSEDKAMYYRDWAAPDEAVLRVDGQGKPVQPDVVVYHVANEPLGLWGASLLESGLDWSRENRKFMQARSAVIQAVARYVYHLTNKGSGKALKDLKARLTTTLTATGGTERNPPPAAASTWLQNQGLKLELQKQDTGAVNATADADLFKTMFGSSVNLPLHYFGDPRTGNLATATAMELPILKGFEMNQQLWTDVYLDLYRYVLAHQGVKVKKAELDVDWPPIIQKDLPKLADALQKLKDVVPELAERAEIIALVFAAAGVNNVTEIVEAIMKKRKEREEEAKANPPVAAPGAPVAGQPPGAAAGAQPQAGQVEALAAAVHRVCDLMEAGSVM
jgi:hypothetical protein